MSYDDLIDILGDYTDRHPCEGCEDYIRPNGCKSNGGCGEMKEEKKVPLSKTITRFVQCVECKNDPAKCRCTEVDEDEHGYCKQWVSWMNGKTYEEWIRERKEE